MAGSLACVLHDFFAVGQSRDSDASGSYALLVFGESSAGRGKISVSLVPK
jgi:hypothetical protein